MLHVVQIRNKYKNWLIIIPVIEKITPETYIKMNEEFEREGTPIRIIVPTQEQIDNPTGVKLPTKFEPQPPMDFDNPWPHGGIKKS